MPTKHYIKHPITPTDLGQRVLRARLSLKETQKEFARRFLVTPLTIHNWESGKTRYINLIYLALLDNLTEKLNKSGELLPVEIMAPIYREDIERQGNALK